MQYKTRWAAPKDYDALGQLMFDAIHSAPSPYSEVERMAWRAEPYSGADWHARLATKHVLIAEDAREDVGFLTVEPGGYIDLCYISPQARERGWFRKMFDQIESHARDMGETRLHTHASLAAIGPFKSVGFHVTECEAILQNGQSLQRAAMEKLLSNK